MISEHAPPGFRKFKGALSSVGRERLPYKVEAEHVVVPVLHVAGESARLSEVQPELPVLPEHDLGMAGSEWVCAAPHVFIKGQGGLGSGDAGRILRGEGALGLCDDRGLMGHGLPVPVSHLAAEKAREHPGGDFVVRVEPCVSVRQHHHAGGDVRKQRHVRRKTEDAAAVGQVRVALEGGAMPPQSVSAAGDVVREEEGGAASQPGGRASPPPSP